MTEKPETISESLKQMDVGTIRRIILEAEAFLAEQVFTNIVTVLKVGVGQGLVCTVNTPEDVAELQVLAMTTPGHPAGWKSLGKLITTAGSLMGRAGIVTQVSVETAPDFDGGACAINIKAFPPSFSFLHDAEEAVTAEEALAFLNVTDDN